MKALVVRKETTQCKFLSDLDLEKTEFALPGSGKEFGALASNPNTVYVSRFEAMQNHHITSTTITTM